MEIRNLRIQDYDELCPVWQNLNDDSYKRSLANIQMFAIFLQRNPRLSFGAWNKGKLVAAILCGQDGQCGYLNIFFADTPNPHLETGKYLVQKTLDRLRQIGIHRCRIFIPGHDDNALKFWNSLGWQENLPLKVLSKNITL